jgi:broad specificity phosphatase PhoE
MAILLVRHGETLGNRNRVVQTPDTALSEHGLAQAARLARRLSTGAIAEIWTSPQSRARMTAAAIEQATGLSAREEVDLEERSFGAIRGTPYAELGFDLMANDYDPPEGESWPVFHERVDRIWDRVEEHWLAHHADGSPASHFVVVSHGLVCRSLLERRLSLGDVLDPHRDEAGRLHLRNTALTVIEPRVADGRIAAYEIPLVGCVAHLEGDEPESGGIV